MRGVRDVAHVGLVCSDARGQSVFVPPPLPRPVPLPSPAANTPSASAASSSVSSSSPSASLQPPLPRQSHPHFASAADYHRHQRALQPVQCTAPAYTPINAVPLPFDKSTRGVSAAIGRCFNCGSDAHALRDCKVRAFGGSDAEAMAQPPTTITANIAMTSAFCHQQNRSIRVNYQQTYALIFIEKWED
jgi:hypothetical protein